MSTTDRDELARIIDEHEWSRLDGGSRGEQIADKVLARYAVVKPAEPDGEDDDGQVYFADFDLRVDTTGQHGYTAHLSPEVSREIDAELLRQRAAAYLAAARLLEEGNNQ